MSESCRAMQDAIADLVSNVLSDDERAAVLEHLDTCPACRNYFLALYQEHQLMARFVENMHPSKLSLDRLTETKTITFWSKIMNKRIIPWAAAAVIVLASGLTVFFAHQTAPEAYAVQQTIDAVKKVQSVHIIGRDWQERKVEVWAKLNPADLSVESCRIEEPEKGVTTVCTPKQMWIFNQKKNEVEIPIGAGASSTLSLGSFLENVQTLNQDLNGSIKTERRYDPEFLQEVICVDVKTQFVELRAIVDCENKLPLRVNVTKGTSGNFQYGLLKNADRILYNEDLSESLFDFQIPAGAKVVDQRTIATSPPGGVLTPEVISWALKYHADALKNAGISTPIHTNTHIYGFDRQRRLTRSGVLVVGNNCKTLSSGELDVSGTSQTNIEAYDTSGKKQKTRLVKSMLGDNFYRVYLTPEPPLNPGESRLYLWMVGQPQPLFSANAEKLHYVVMQNHFGPEVLESFILVVPPEVRVQVKSEDFTRTERVGDVQVYIWQKRVPSNENHYVKVGLDAESLAP